MNKKWEIREVCTPEQTFEKINTKMAQPVGIVLFGADCDFKNEVLDAMVDGLRGFARYYTKAPDTATLVRAIKDHLAVVVVLNSDESSTHELRHELVKVMRNAGAKTVVGIYAKVDQVPISPLISSLEKVEFNKRITAIEQSNPTADGLDYFIVVEEEEG